MRDSSFFIDSNNLTPYKIINNLKTYGILCENFFYLFLIFFILPFKSYNVFSSNIQLHTNKCYFKTDDITKSGKLKEIHFYIKEQFEKLKTAAE